MLTGYTNPNKKPPHTQDGILQMGATGYVDINNQLHVLGRSDSMIIVGGKRPPRISNSNHRFNARIRRSSMHRSRRQ